MAELFGQVPGSRRRRRRHRILAVGVVPLLLLLGCGDDPVSGGDDTAATSEVDGTTTTTTGDDATTTTADDATTTTAGDEPATDSETADAGDYCELAAQLDEQDGPPSIEQLQALVESAPEEIREDVTFVADRLMEAGDGSEMFAVFNDPEVQERFGPIEAFETEECGLGGDSEEPEGASQEILPDASQVEVTAVEYDFQFDAPSPGAVSFVMTNEGEEPHFMGIGKLLEGVTVEEAIKADDPSEVTEWTADSAVAAPGEEAVLSFENLEPGEYGMVCFIPGPDGEPHAYKGMAVGFTVE